MKKVVITGATGTIGTALIANLINNGIKVLVFTRADSSRNNVIPVNPLVEVKFCSLDELADVQNDTSEEYDVFYHFAWSKTVGAGRNDIYSQVQNIKYTLDAVAAAKRFGCHTFIGAGSQAEYGRVNVPLMATTPCFPENGYGMAKLCAGQMSREYAHQLGIKHIWPRILSVYGKNGGNDFITYLISALQKGEVINCTKGEQIWDYLYSADIADVLRLLGDKGVDGKIYPLGSGAGRPLREYIEEVRGIINPSAQINFGGRAYSEKEVMHLVADVSELISDTGWHPTTTFIDGIKEILK